MRDIQRAYLAGAQPDHAVVITIDQGDVGDGIGIVSTGAPWQELIDVGVEALEERVIGEIGLVGAQALAADLDIREEASLGTLRLATSAYVGYGPLQPHSDPNDRLGASCWVYVVVGKPTRLVPPFLG